MTIVLPKPTRLAAAVAAAVQAHPYGASGRISPSPRVELDAARIWERLVSLEGAERSEAVGALHPFEARILTATARPRLGQAAVLAILASVLDQCRPEGAASLAWDVHLLTDGHPGFRRLAAEHLQQSGSVPPAWASLVRQAKPSEATAALYHAQAQQFDRWISGPAVALDAFVPLVQRVQRQLLAAGALSRLSRQEPSAAIERWVQLVIPAGEREAWYVNFLEETTGTPRPFDHAVLRAVLERFGEPSDGRPFWANVSDTARRAFELWIMDARLTQLLGEGERVEFWRRFLSQIKKPTQNRDRQVVFIDLGVAVAVQFVNSGTATYLFTPLVFRLISRDVEADVRRSVYDNAHRCVASYEHRGYAWRWTAEGKVRRALTELSHV